APRVQYPLRGLAEWLARVHGGGRIRRVGEAEEVPHLVGGCVLHVVGHAAGGDRPAAGRRVDEGGRGRGGVHLHVRIDQLAGGDDVARGRERHDGRAVVPAVVGVSARPGRDAAVSRRGHRRAEGGAEQDQVLVLPALVVA